MPYGITLIHFPVAFGKSVHGTTTSGIVGYRISGMFLDGTGIL